MDGGMFVNSLHTILTSSVNPETGVNTQRLFQLSSFCSGQPQQ